jgi:hypothetical protein
VPAGSVLALHIGKILDISLLSLQADHVCIPLIILYSSLTSVVKNLCNVVTFYLLNLIGSKITGKWNLSDKINQPLEQKNLTVRSYRKEHSSPP